ncbi:MFS transporter [Streptomyces sp. WAC 06783]|uniref:MFS transporter n=1 Tax=Streptomyces sp. WAC 06783 TaxID=2203211 RepID=UPI00100325B1|nr:MFS transporter [Streptomyces sp. WAC 06783]RSO07016.1 MFS transporter [Streptomyces sp. WAC 06783]
MTPPSSAGPPASLWRHRPYRLYVLGEAGSVAGSSVSSVAIPYLAVVELDAGTGQVALLTFLTQLPKVLVALHAGALADRHRKRPLMICSDLVSAAVLLTLPLAAAFGVLSLAQLMAVALLQTTAVVVHDAAAISYLPSLLDRPLLQKGNSRIGALFSIAATAGSSLGALLVGLAGAARAVAFDAASYLISAWCTARIGVREPLPVRQRRGQQLADIRDGLRYVFGDTTLRTLTLTNAAISFALGILNTVWSLYLLRELRFGSTAFGVTMAVAALGSFAGALLAPQLTNRCGPGPMLLAALALLPLTQIPLLIAVPGTDWQIMIALALAVQLFCAAATGTTQRSIRQIVTAEHMQGRMQAVSTWLTGGARPVAAAVAGAIGSAWGVWSALAVGSVLLLVPVVLFVISPMRHLHAMPQDPPGHVPAAHVQEPGQSQPSPQSSASPLPTHPGGDQPRRPHHRPDPDRRRPPCPRRRHRRPARPQPRPQPRAKGASPRWDTHNRNNGTSTTPAASAFGP